MPVDASIPLQVQMPQFLTPLQAQQNVLALKDQMAQTQIRQQQVQQNNLNIRDQQELTKAWADKSNVDPQTGLLDPKKVQGAFSNPLLYQKALGLYNDAQYKMSDEQQKKQKSMYEANTEQQKIRVDTLKSAHDVYLQAIEDGKPNAEELFQESLQEKANDAIKSGLLPPDTKIPKTTGELAGKNLFTYQQQQDKTTPFEKEAEAAYGKGTPEYEAALKAHVARMDAPTQSMTGGSPTIQGDALDIAANQLLIDGKLPSGFTRNSANVGAIYNRAAELAKAKGQTGEAAMLNAKSVKADSTSLTNLTKQSDMVKAFESTALKNLDMLVAQSDKIPRTAFPILNKAIMTGRIETGDPEVAKYYAMVRPFVDEYAKILSGSTGSAGASDTSRREAAGIISPYFSPEQIKELAPFIHKEMDNRTDSLNEQRDIIKSRMSGKTPEVASAEKTKSVTVNGSQMEAKLAPDGKYYVKQPNGKYAVVN